MKPGQLLGARYRLDEPLASGGMSDVWRATDQVLARTVAVKIMRPALLTEPGFAARFHAEARMLAALHHPGVVEVYDYGAGTDGEGGDSFLVMAHVDGQPLSARIAEAGRLSPAETMSVTAKAARALHAAHTAGIVHRDVKPANLLLTAGGDVVLVDFGVARSDAVPSVTGLHEVVGTALYMAPEQVTKRELIPATDVYALGAVAYHCLAGHPPFLGDNPVQVALHHLEEEPPPLPADVPEPVQELVRRAMAKDPADRFPDAAAFAEAAEGTGLAVDGGAGAAGMAVPTVALAHPAAAGAGEPVASASPLAGGAQPVGSGPAAPGVSEGSDARRRRTRSVLAAAAVVASLLGLAMLALLFRPGPAYGPAVPGEQVPGTGTPASTGPRAPGPGGAPSGGTAPGTGSSGTGPARTTAPGPATTTARTPRPPSAPATQPPPSPVPTPVPTSVPAQAPTSAPADDG